VEQRLGRLPLLQLQVDSHAVTLVGTNHLARHVEGEPLLVVGLHALNQIVVRDREAVPPGGVEQFIDRHPTSRLERQPEVVRGMPKMLRQVLAEPNEAIFHERDSESIPPSIQSS
jgi:hypothetical protein